MFLTTARYEHLAGRGVWTPYSSLFLFDVVHARECGWNGLTIEGALVVAAAASMIECIVRAPFALIASTFSRQWLMGMQLNILTVFYAIHATVANLFVKSLKNTLIQADITMRSFQKDRFLFQACEAGREDLVRQLVKMGADPHRILDADATSALVPRLAGQPHLTQYFSYDDYEKDFLDLRLTSLWQGLYGSGTLHGNPIRFDGAPSLWLFESLAESMQRFRTWGDFRTLQLGQKNAEVLHDALYDAYVEKSNKTIANKIQKGELVFLNSGWMGHAICITFFKGYMAIGNRGEGCTEHSTLDVYKVDPKRVTPHIVEEILKHQFMSRFWGERYFYQRLPNKLSGKKDALCEAFKEIAPKASKEGSCALASKKAGLRFAWALLLADSPTKAQLERARLESKMFTDWSSYVMLHNEDLRKKFVNVTPLDRIRNMAQLKWQAKVERFLNTRRELGLGFYLPSV